MLVFLLAHVFNLWLNFKSIKELVNYKGNFNGGSPQILSNLIDENREENKTNVKKLKAKLAKQQLDSLGTSRLYSLVQKIKTTL